MHPRLRREPQGLRPDLYQARRPTTSPTKSLRPQRPLPRREAGAASAGAASSVSLSGEGAATLPPPPRGRALLPYAPSASAGSAVKLALERSGSRLSRSAKSDDGREKEGPSAPRLASSLPHHAAQSSAWRPSALEVLLHHTVAVEEQNLSEADVGSVVKVIETLRHRRRQRKGVKPTPPLFITAPANRATTSTTTTTTTTTARQRLPSLAPVSSSTSSLSLADDIVVAALVAACEAPTTDAALDVLLSCYRPPSPVGSGDSEHATSLAPCTSSSCLLAAAIVEVRCPQHCQLTSNDLALLDAAAKSGHPAAILRIGLCLRDGCAQAGVGADLAAALTYMETAAATAYVPAMHEMGLLYELGCTTADAVLEADWGEAVRWYRRAAAAGHAPSQLNLGKLLLTATQEQAATTTASAEELVELRQRSREWLEQAAQDGNAEALHLLSRIS